MAFIVVIFALEAPSMVVPSGGTNLYATLVVFAMGMAAIVWQKFLHRDKVRDMGFRLNRNVVIGLAVVATFTAIQLVLTLWLPLRAGAMEVMSNEKSELLSQGMSPLGAVLLSLLAGGLGLFLAALFGEELAFRGYVLPQLSKLYGNLKSIAICSVLFGMAPPRLLFRVRGWGSSERLGVGVANAARTWCFLHPSVRPLLDDERVVQRLSLSRSRRCLSVCHYRKSGVGSGLRKSGLQQDRFE